MCLDVIKWEGSGAPSPRAPTAPLAMAANSTSRVEASTISPDAEQPLLASHWAQAMAS